MPNTARKGNGAERAIAKEMESQGFVVASRRHIGGAGDLLGVHPDGRIWLVECKARKSLYAGFTRADREAMHATPLPSHAELWVANKQGKDVVWIESDDWP